MFRCRIPIAIFLALTLPLQSFASGTCCQRGQESCCSISSNQSDGQAKSCCSRIPTEAQPSGCKHCAAAKENAKTNSAAVDRCSCHCKRNPQDRPATEYRRQLHVESVLASQGSIFVAAQPSIPARLKIEVADRLPGLRLHAINCVWLI
jgi:hypothetical protein